MQASDFRAPRIRRALATLALAAATTTATIASAAPSFTPDAAVLGWTSRPVLTNHNLVSGREVAFRNELRVSDWSGGLYAEDIDASGNTVGTGPWTSLNVTTILDAQHWDTGRRIVTRNASGTAIPLRWISLSASQQTALGSDGSLTLDFVRGNRADEDPSGKKWRKRSTVLGDIQHSTLLHWSHTGGARRLYVGANDGMLHAFDAANGNEVFAYVPSMLIGKLKDLRAKPYAPKLFVDGGLAIADVVIGGSTRTLLAGTLGGGERGLFMLDISDPNAATETAAAAKIKWEITPSSTGFANLGFSYSRPRFARLNNGVAVLIVGNGYVPLTPGSLRSSLYIINADTGALIREIDTGALGVGGPGGLSTPTLDDTNGDGLVDLVYVGDIDGKVWRFDLGSTDPNAFSVTLLHTTSPAQAITVAPTVFKHPAGGRIVMFGTGRVLTAADKTDTAVHYVYGLWDGAPAANTTLLTQTLTEVSFNGDKLRYASANAPNWASGGHRGWRLTLPVGGERVLGEAPFINDDRYYFTTANPTIAAAAAGQPSGMNWSHQVHFLSGGGIGRSVFDVDGSGVINAADKVSGQFIMGQQIGAGVASQPVLVDLDRFSMTIFNLLSDVDDTVSPPPPSDPGVSGGHFDVDIYHFASPGNTNSAYGNRKHTHQYDDKYNVTGVNFMAASDVSYNLAKMIPDATRPFKVLVMNQYLNPASQLAIGNGGFVPVKSYGALATESNATTLWNSLPIYTRNDVGSLMWRLPLDGFASKDWWGDGSAPRAGLIPNQTGCVNRVTNRGVTTAGLHGERFNGALTIQLVRTDTPVSALELNYPAGGPKYGWRLSTTAANNNYTYLLGEYTMFWHHPNGKCYNGAGWVANAPQETSSRASRGTAKAVGSSDPTGGSFSYNASVPPGVSVVSVSTSTVGTTTTVTTQYSDGRTARTITTVNGDGTESVVMIDRDGNRSDATRVVGGTLTSGKYELLAASRRITWREIVRP